jgi:CBS domain-containing protein/anti-sigma regulatory factor (Ser/Thr protein kinase)
MKSDRLPRVLTVGIAQELAYELRVEQAMTRKVFTVSPENTVEDLSRFLCEQKISGAPVVEKGSLVGIVSIEDLIRALMEGTTSIKVREKMSTDVVTLFADEPLVQALSQFAHHRYGRLPVLDRSSRKVVGILTKGDIVRCLLKKLESDHTSEEQQQCRAGHLFEDVESDASMLVLRHKVQGADFQKAGEASSKLKKNLIRLGFPPNTARRITIASYEAEMNMVIFTSGGEIVACIEPEKVTVNAVDTGPGIPDIERAMQPGYSTAPDWVRELGFGAGMGLPNIKSCSDEMKIDSTVGKGTNVQFIVYAKLCN